jgi:acetoin utilization protein AcuB
MLVEDVMQRDLITVTPGTTLPEALRLSRGRGIRHLPVMDDGDLVGIVSDRDLKRAMASPATSLERHELNYLLEKVTMEEIMTRAVITVGPMLPVEEAARLMIKERISALPVTEQGRVVGIVTETDVLELFLRAMGAGEPSSRLDVFLPAESHALGDAVNAIEDAGAGISSIVTLPRRDGRKEVVIRVRTINPGPAIKRLEARGYAVRNPWRG